MKEEVIKAIAEMLDVEKVLWAGTILVLTWVLLLGLKQAFSYLAQRFTRQRVAISSLFPVLRLFIWIMVAGFIVVAVFRPPLNTVVALSAAAGVAVGLGAQDLIRNVLAGVLILLERPFRVGDMIRAGSHYGEVVNIGLRATEIHTFGDSIVTLPNALLLSQGVSNANVGSLHELVEVKFCLPATVDVGKVKELARETALCSPYVHRKKPVTVLVGDHFDHAFLSTFTVKAYTMDLRFERLLASDLIERIKEEINARGWLPENGRILPGAG